MAKSTWRRLAQARERGEVHGWDAVPDVLPEHRAVFETAGIDPEAVLAWCPYGADDHRSGGRAWTPWRLSLIVEDLGPDRAREALAHARAIGVQDDPDARERFGKLVYDSGPEHAARVLLLARSVPLFRWAVRALETRSLVPEMVPTTPLGWRLARDWAGDAGFALTGRAFTESNADDSGLCAPACPVVSPGWSVFGPVVPWLVAYGHQPTLRDLTLSQEQVDQVVSAVTAGAAHWGREAADPALPWWSDAWYESVDVPRRMAGAARAAGWEPPLAAFLLRWALGVKHAEIPDLFAPVPVGFLRAVQREGVVNDVHPAHAVDAARVVGADVLLGWARRFGGLRPATTLVDLGVSADLVDQVDARWPGHPFFDFPDGAYACARTADSTLRGQTGLWGQVALTVLPDGAPLPVGAHVVNPDAWSPWVAAAVAAGLSPEEALVMVQAGVPVESVRVVAGLRT